MIVATLDRVTALRAASRASSSTSAARARRSSIPPSSMTQTSRRPGSWSRTFSTAARWLGDSTTTAAAPESSRIHWTWSGEEVS